MPLKKQFIQQGLITRYVGKYIEILPSINSTNDYLMHLASQGAPSGTVILAEEQTAGKGRNSNTWQSMYGYNIYCSILVSANHLRANEAGFSALGLSIAVQNAIQKTCRLTCSIKWPNDIRIEKRKLAGILIESCIQNQYLQHFVAGIGINVNQPSFPDELPYATSIMKEIKKEMDRNVLISAILNEIEHVLNRWWKYHDQHLLLRQYHNLSDVWQKTVRLINENTNLEGVVIGFQTDGSLLLEDRSGLTRIIQSGVMSLRD